MPKTEQAVRFSFSSENPTWSPTNNFCQLFYAELFRSGTQSSGVPSSASACGLAKIQQFEQMGGLWTRLKVEHPQEFQEALLLARRRKDEYDPVQSAMGSIQYTLSTKEANIRTKPDVQEDVRRSERSLEYYLKKRPREIRAMYKDIYAGPQELFTLLDTVDMGSRSDIHRVREVLQQQFPKVPEQKGKDIERAYNVALDEYKKSIQKKKERATPQLRQLAQEMFRLKMSEIPETLSMYLENIDDDTVKLQRIAQDEVELVSLKEECQRLIPLVDRAMQDINVPLYRLLTDLGNALLDMVEGKTKKMNLRHLIWS